MKTKMLIAINICLVIILLFTLFKKTENSNLNGSYQNKNTNPVIQVVIDNDNFTEYINSKITKKGKILTSKDNAYILEENDQNLFLYKDDKNIYYIPSNFDNKIFKLEKFSDIPTYITSQ